MSAAVQILVANIPMLIVAGLGAFLVERGHDGFAIAFLILAFMLTHMARGKGE